MEKEIAVIEELIDVYEAGYKLSKMLGLVDEEIEDLISRSKSAVEVIKGSFVR